MILYFTSLSTFLLRWHIRNFIYTVAFVFYKSVIFTKSDITNILWNLFYVASKKKWYKWTYLQNRNRVTDREKKFMATKMKERGGINWEIGVNKYARMK